MITPPNHVETENDSKHCVKKVHIWSSSFKNLVQMRENTEQKNSKYQLVLCSEIILDTLW